MAIWFCSSFWLITCRLVFLFIFKTKTKKQFHFLKCKNNFDEVQTITNAICFPPLIETRCLLTFVRHPFNLSGRQHMTLGDEGLCIFYKHLLFHLSIYGQAIWILWVILSLVPYTISFLDSRFIGVSLEEEEEKKQILGKFESERTMDTPSEYWWPLYRLIWIFYERKSHLVVGACWFPFSFRPFFFLI